MPDHVTTSISPVSFRDGEPVFIRIDNARHLADKETQVVVAAVTHFETIAALRAPITIRSNGSGEVAFTSGFSLGQEASVYVDSVSVMKANDEAETHVFRKARPAILNPTVEIRSPSDAAKMHELIEESQSALLTAPIGDPDSEDAVEHRVLSIIEGLLITSELHLPGVVVRPLPQSFTGIEDRTIVDQVLTDLGWACRIGESQWANSVRSSRPLAAIVIDPIFAKDYEEAGQLARLERDKILAILALNRQASGRSICLVIEQRLPDNRVLSKWAPEYRQYQGNLAGGFLAGESQSQLIRERAALTKEPLLQLACELFAEALSYTSEDAKYFRYWSIFELLADARVERTSVATLLDGRPWPSEHSRTKYVKPRVYEYLKRTVFSHQVNEPSFCHPAGSLHELIEVWYARRNATGHFGVFRQGDEVQVKEHWYVNALKSVSYGREEWLRTMRRMVISSIQRELHAPTA